MSLVDWISDEFLEARACTLRLGSIGDGGYTVALDHVKDTKLLISGGLSSNIEFEFDFYRFAPTANLLLIDPTVSRFKLLAKGIARSFLPKKEKTRYLYNSLIFYHMLRDKRCLHIQHWIEKVDFIKSAESFFNVKLSPRSVFFKCDVEGAEYKILPYLLDYKLLFNSIVIEFHDCHLYSDQVRYFVKELSEYFSIIDMVINSSGGYHNNSEPKNIELSFCSKL